MSGPVFRFAPSPNGRLHLGHAYSALLNERLAREAGGQLLLRIEDIDPLRATPAFRAAIEEDLAWLGIRFDGPVRRQSEHMDEYREAAARLRQAGFLYPCFCSRGDVSAVVARREQVTGEPWPRDPDGSPLYPGTCRALPVAGRAVRIATGAPHAWRIDMSRALDGLGPLGWRQFAAEAGEAHFETWVEANPARWGDAIVVRKDVPASYHLCVVHDDARQGVTHVVRGAELEATTDLHAVLAARLGLTLPRYHHHALILGPDGTKLAKSRGSASLFGMRGTGITADEIRERLFGTAAA